MSNESIREYEIIDGPFSGTYGQVHIGRHKLLGWTRAIKQLHAYVRAETLLQEALALRQVRSPYVVQIFEFFDDPQAIVMEYCPEGLDDYLKERLGDNPRGLPYDDARELLHGILLGLNDAHLAGVTHGDIKPANVRFGTGTAPGQLGLPKLGDFGAARYLRDKALRLRGSTNWMAPEVLHGNEPTRESDCFSFGVLAYLILSGRHPFYADDPTTLTAEDDNIRNPAFVPVSLGELRSDIPKRVSDLIMELLSRDPRVRATAGQELNAALAEPPERQLAAVDERPTPAQIAAEDVHRIDALYARARGIFFSEFRPKHAVDLLNTTLADLRWERFKGTGFASLADCWSLRAYINNSSGFFEEAVVAATNGLDVYDAHVSSLHSRGYAHLQLGDYHKAGQDLQRALELSTEPRKRAQISKLLDTIRVREPLPDPEVVY